MGCFRQLLGAWDVNRRVRFTVLLGTQVHCHEPLRDLLVYLHRRPPERALCTRPRPEARGRINQIRSMEEQVELAYLPLSQLAHVN